MNQDRSASTARLLQLCAGYFGAYVFTGILVKWFTVLREPKLAEMTYLFNNTIGGSVLALGLVIALGWIRLKSNRLVRWGPFQVPSEVAYIIPSGVCTAVVIPATTLMYLLPISVLVAMVIMRGSIIVISRLVDEVQLRQGILKKRVYGEENWAVVFALLAVATNVLLIPVVDALEARGVAVAHLLGLKAGAGKGSFAFLGSAAAMTILGSYIVAYAFRLYIMNYFKNTRAQGVPQDNQGFFAIEQIAASVSMVLLGALFFVAPQWLGWSARLVLQWHDAVTQPHFTAFLSGLPYGVVAFFSVFIFMFKGRTATFAGLVNRLTSLVAGTTATVLTALLFKTRYPTTLDWVSLGFILVAVYFLSRAEQKRVGELKGTADVPAVGPAVAPAPAAAGR
ncbi:MAG TPA: hypothetical protein VGK89_13950 [Candidatus Eisenbacteria bacterium]|jgi:hypothetical protein